MTFVFLYVLLTSSGGMLPHCVCATSVWETSVWETSVSTTSNFQKVSSNIDLVARKNRNHIVLCGSRRTAGLSSATMLCYTQTQKRSKGQTTSFAFMIASDQQKFTHLFGGHNFHPFIPCVNFYCNVHGAARK